MEGLQGILPPLRHVSLVCRLFGSILLSKDLGGHVVDTPVTYFGQLCCLSRLLHAVSAEDGFTTFRWLAGYNRSATLITGSNGIYLRHDDCSDLYWK